MDFQKDNVYNGIVKRNQKVVITDVWTPTGVVSVTGISNTITVSGTVFDDFYVGA